MIRQNYPNKPGARTLENISKIKQETLYLHWPLPLVSGGLLGQGLPGPPLKDAAGQDQLVLGLVDRYNFQELLVVSYNPYKGIFYFLLVQNNPPNIINF